MKNRQLTLRLLAALFATALYAGAAAQSVSISNVDFFETNFRGRVVDSLTREPLPSAVISVATKHDSGATTVRNYAADAKGMFRFVCTTVAQHRMEVAVLGYKPKAIYLATTEAERHLGDVLMVQSSEKIDEVVVKARLHMYKMRGDTIVYMPRAVNTLKDDGMIEILRQMPGVEVSDDGSVKILGEVVTRTYVNNKLLFGENPTVAINQLDAKEVASIEAYDEVDEEDAIKNGKNARKRKVLNVVTFKEFSRSLSAGGIAEAGTGFKEDPDGKRPVRYLASAEGGYYSERMQVALDAQTSNVQRPKGRLNNLNNELRDTKANASISGREGAHQYSAQYAYDNMKWSNLNATQQDYYPTEAFSSQFVSDTTRRKTNTGSHNVILNYGYSTKTTRVSTSFTGGLTKEREIEQLLQRTQRNEALLSATDRYQNIKTDLAFMQWSGNFSQAFKNGNSLSVNAGLDIRDAPSRGFQDDQQLHETTTTLLSEYLRIPKFTGVARGGVGYGVNLGKAGSISIGTELRYEEQHDGRLYTDRLTDVLDLARSEDAYEKRTAWATNVGYRFRREEHSVGAKVDYTLENRHFTDPLRDYSSQRQFNQLHGRLDYSYYAPKKNFSVNLGNTSHSPPMRDLLARVDDRNPLRLRAGNPKLTPATNYTLALNGNWFYRSSSVEVRADAVLIDNSAISRTTYYADATRLPNYNNYLVPAGATFTTSENGASHMRVSAVVNYKTRLAPLRCFFTANVSYTYLNPMSVLNDVMERSQNHRGSVALGLTSNFSSEVRIALKGTTEVRSYKGFDRSHYSLSEFAEASVTWDILPTLFARAEYVGIFSYNSDRFATPPSHLLNCSIGYRILNERGRVAFNAYDILSAFTSVGYSQGTLYTSYSWTGMRSNFFTFSFEYKINHRK